MKASKLRPNDSGMFIYGPAGSGKTTEAAAVLAAMLPELAVEQNGVSPRYQFSAAWVSAPMLTAELRQSFQRKAGPTELEIINRYIGLKMLVLDDLGAEKASEYNSQSMYLLLSERINWLRPTIVTSNMNPDEIHKIDPRLGSRLCGMQTVRFTHRDFRAEG